MRWEHEATERRYIWPYRVREFVVKASAAGQLVHNGNILKTWEDTNWQQVDDDNLRDASTRWNIFEQEAGWDTIDLRLLISVDDLDGMRSEVVPQVFNPPLFFTALIRCPATRLRYAVTQPITSSQCELIVRLKRNEVFGEISIEPAIVLGSDLEKAPAGWARIKGSIICNGYKIHLYPDKPEESFGGGLDIQWLEFPESSKNALYYLAIETADNFRPVLYVNNRHTGLKSIIDGTEKRGEKARTRNAIYALMAPNIWIQLAEFAASMGDEAGDEELQERVDRIMNCLSRRLGMSQEKIKTDIENPEARRDLFEAIQHLVRTGVSVNNMVTEMPETSMEE